MSHRRTVLDVWKNEVSATVTARLDLAVSLLAQIRDENRANTAAIREDVANVGVGIGAVLFRLGEAARPITAEPPAATPPAATRNRKAKPEPAPTPVATEPAQPDWVVKNPARNVTTFRSRFQLDVLKAIHDAKAAGTLSSATFVRDKGNKGPGEWKVTGKAQIRAFSAILAQKCKGQTVRLADGTIRVL